MNDTVAKRTQWMHALAILMDCPEPGCDGRIALHSTSRHHVQAVGVCARCGVPAVLRGGVLEPRGRRSLFHRRPAAQGARR